MASSMFTYKLRAVVFASRQFSTAVTRRSSDILQVHNHSGVRTVCLNNLSKRNVLSLEMLAALEKAISPVETDLRVIIIKATGPVFSSGHDLKELTTAFGMSHQRRVFEKCTDVMMLLQDIPVPVIAQVNGLAAAAGCQLVATCDIAVASAKSRFSLPGAMVGLFCSTPAVAVARTVPAKVAMEMLFTGDEVSAQDALSHGLLSKVVQEDKLEEEVMKIADKICSKSKPVIALGKACFYKQIGQSREAAYKTAVEAMIGNLQLKDGQEGIASFSKKRAPVWLHTNDKVN